MTETDATTMKADEVEALAADGLRWLLSVARDTGDGGIGWPIRPSDADVDPMLYNGTAGVVPVLLEAWRHFGDDSYADAARRTARCLARSVEEWQDDSLYFGRTGMALALRAVHADLGDPAAGAAADQALELVRA
ncbi:lanthionine synthetase C family protein, partial [Streptomyces sp. Lzd4kr]|nr:lanthionine synthetase C family protein [Streptomyces sp. Lzd4kr]